jgi:hypothetical protein
MSINVCNNNSLSAITSIPASISGGALNLISTQTASSSATISFTSGIDSTYKEYIFKFIDIHPATDAAEFQVNLSADGGSNYNVTKTTTLFHSRHSEDDTSEVGISYTSSDDLAQSTSFLTLFLNAGNGNDESSCGTLHLFDPSDTTFVKHFISRTQGYHNADTSFEYYVAGYGNTTSAINAVQFKMSSGNIDAGTIKLYGVS